MHDTVAAPNRNWILVALMVTMTLAAMDITIVSTAVPQIVADLGGFSQFTWVFSIYLLAQTVTIPIYGKMSDLYGRKNILIFGITVFMIGSAAAASSWNMISLIGFRGLQGLGAGSIMATVNTIAGDIYTVEERAKIQGYLSSIWGVSAILGPTLGGAFAEYASWRWIFLINLPLGAASIFLIVVFFKEKVEPIKQTIDYVGAVLILTTLGLMLIYLMESGQSWPWVSFTSIGLAVTIVILVLFTYYVEARSPYAILPVWLWKNRTLAFTNFAMVGMGIVMMGPEAFMPTFTQASLGLGSIASGFVLASMSLGWPTASALSGRLYLKIGFRETSLIGTSFITFACALFLIIPHPQPIYLIVLDQILIGVGFGLLSTPSLVGAQSMVAWRERGVVTGSIVFSRNLGQALGAAIFGAIFNNSLVLQLKNTTHNLPNSSGSIVETLQNPAVPEVAKTFLREAINNSMSHIYWGLVAFAAFIFYNMYRVPRRNPKDTTLLDITKK